MLAKSHITNIMKAMHVDNSIYRYDFDHEKLEKIWLRKQLDIAQYSHPQLVEFDSYLKKYSQLFLEVRSNRDYAVANKKINAIDQTVKITMPKILRDFCLCRGKSVRAYNFYSQQYYEEAIRETHQCIDLLDEITAAGISTEINQIIQQNVNLVQVYVRMGERDKASILAKSIIQYIYQGKYGDNLYGKAFYNSLNHADTMHIITEQYGLSWVNQIIACLSYMEKLNMKYAKKWFYNIFGDFSVNISISTLDRVAIDDWVVVKKAFYNESYDVFLNLSAAFLQEFPYRQAKGLIFAIYQNVKTVFDNYKLDKESAQIQILLTKIWQ